VAEPGLMGVRTALGNQLRINRLLDELEHTKREYQLELSENQHLLRTILKSLADHLDVHVEDDEQGDL
jgi:hypothetical protein